MLSDVTSIHSNTPPRVIPSSYSNANFEHGVLDSSLSRANGRSFLPGGSTNVINEVSEPPTPDGLTDTIRGRSYLTHLLRNSPPETEPETKNNFAPSHQQIDVSNVSSKPSSLNEQSSLLPKVCLENDRGTGYDAIRQEDEDIESQGNFRSVPRTGIKKAISWPKEKGLSAMKNAIHNKAWNKKDVWEKGVVQTASYLPAVFLGLLLNILDGLSYGRSGLSIIFSSNSRLTMMMMMMMMQG